MKRNPAGAGQMAFLRSRQHFIYSVEYLVMEE
jgi:hypothetical protein